MKPDARWGQRILGLRIAPATLGAGVSSSDVPLLSISGASLYGAGATLVLVTALTTHTRSSALLPVLGVAAIAYTVTIALVLGRHRWPAAIFPYLTAAGTVLITLLMFFDQEKADAYTLLYLLAAVYAFYFYRLAVAFLELGLIAVLSAIDFYLRSSVNLPTARWVLMIGTSLAAGLTIQRLVAKVRELADLDGLTSLANRRRMETELRRELARAARGDTDLTLVMLDLDRFKEFNDELGHVEGDRHLRQTTAQWRAQLRDVDLLARWGGEEFAILLPGSNLYNGTQVADRVRAATSNGQTVSAGVAHWDGTESAASLVARADAALYEAKVAGRDRTVAAAAGERTENVPQMWAKMLPSVLAERSIRFAYQPIVRFTDRTVLAYEALARPNQSGVDLSVDGLFAAAQRLGYGRDLDWICRRLCLETSRPLIAGPRLFMNIGVPALLAPVHGPDQMSLLLEYTNWDPSELTLEITERDLISDLDRFSDVLAAYREEGFTFAIDDVGDGHSTLEVLAAACPEYIKVARRLTARASQPGPRAAIKAVVSFATSIGATVIAEGIEDEYQAVQMADLGCHLGQGYGLGRPQWLEAHQTVASPVPLRVVG